MPLPSIPDARIRPYSSVVPVESLSSRTVKSLPRFAGITCLLRLSSVSMGTVAGLSPFASPSVKLKTLVPIHLSPYRVARSASSFSTRRVLSSSPASLICYEDMFPRRSYSSSSDWRRQTWAASTATSCSSIATWPRPVWREIFCRRSMRSTRDLIPFCRPRRRSTKCEQEIRNR